MKSMLSNKKLIIKSAMILLLILIIVTFNNQAKGQISLLSEQNQSLEESLNKSNSENEKLSDEISKIEEELDKSNSKFNKIEKEYSKYKKEMKPYEGIAKEEAKAKEAELAKQREEAEAEKKRVAAEKKAVEEKAAAEKKAEEEKAVEEEKARKEAEITRGYETGITFDQLARTPDDYEDEKIKFYGRVVQVMEGDTHTALRFAVDDNYDTVMYCEVPKSLISNNRILEDDYVTLSGVSYGLLTYKSTLGGEITIPSMIVDVIDR